MTDQTDPEEQHQRVLDAMVEHGWPSVTVDGSFWYFEHTGELHQIRALNIEHADVTVEAFKERYRETTGRKWRG